MNKRSQKRTKETNGQTNKRNKVVNYKKYEQTKTNEERTIK